MRGGTWRGGCALRGRGEVRCCRALSFSDTREREPGHAGQAGPEPRTGPLPCPRSREGSRAARWERQASVLSREACPQGVSGIPAAPACRPPRENPTWGAWDPTVSARGCTRNSETWRRAPAGARVRECVCTGVCTSSPTRAAPHPSRSAERRWSTRTFSCLCNPCPSGKLQCPQGHQMSTLLCLAHACCWKMSLFQLISGPCYCGHRDRGVPHLWRPPPCRQPGPSSHPAPPSRGGERFPFFVSPEAVTSCHHVACESAWAYLPHGEVSLVRQLDTPS